MATKSEPFEFEMEELREVARYAIACAEAVLEIFERACPNDSRARVAIDSARSFATGGPRTHQLRVVALDAHRAARAAYDSGCDAAGEAARSAGHAAASAYLHPLYKSTQVLHILGSAAHAAYALERNGDDTDVTDPSRLTMFVMMASPAVADVLMRYPPAPGGGGRAGEVLRELDAAIRSFAGDATRDN
jgi:hypothetical protein